MFFEVAIMAKILKTAIIWVFVNIGSLLRTQSKDNKERNIFKVKDTKKIISSLNSSVESIKIKLNETEDLISDAKEDLHNTEVGIETKKVEIHSLQNNIELNNNELEQLTGNIENLKVRSDKPDLKLSELENILSEHLKIQNIHV